MGTGVGMDAGGLEAVEIEGHVIDGADDGAIRRKQLLSRYARHFSVHQRAPSDLHNVLCDTIFLAYTDVQGATSKHNLRNHTLSSFANQGFPRISPTVQGRKSGQHILAVDD